MNMIRSFFIAFSMYSKIPMPKTEWTEDAMKYSMCFFPLIGAVIGALVLLWMNIAEYLEVGKLLFSVGVVLLPLVISGGIHMDGLLDTADALSSYQSREEKLEILKDPNAGAFAVITGIGYYLLYVGICSEITREGLFILAVGFVLSRALSGLAIVSFSMAKNTGLAATFSDMALKNRVRLVMVLYIAICSGVMLRWNLLLGGGAVFGSLLTFFYYRKMSYKKFGGITGDLAGFFLQLCELVMAVCVVVLELLGGRG